MQPLVDLATASAAIAGIETQAATARATLAPMDKATAFGLFLDAIKKDGEPPMLDMALTCLGGLDYTEMFAGLPGFVAQLYADGKIPEAVSPVVLAALSDGVGACDLHKQDFANLGQSIRDLFATPGLKAAMGLL